MNIRNIVKKYLIKNNYDGLYNPKLGCSCNIEELMDCEWIDQENCKAGYYIPKEKWTIEEIEDNCNYVIGDLHE